LLVYLYPRLHKIRGLILMKIFVGVLCGSRDN